MLPKKPATKDYDEQAHHDHNSHNHEDDHSNTEELHSFEQNKTGKLDIAAATVP